MKRIVIFTLLVAMVVVWTACGGGGGSGEVNFTQLFIDPVDDLVLMSGAPSEVIPYPPVDITDVSFSMDGNYLYLKLQVADMIPLVVQSVEGNTVESQGFNLALNSDNDSETGPNGPGISGIETVFSIHISYGPDMVIETYAYYGEATGTVDNLPHKLDGQWRGGGPGNDYVIARYNVSGMGDYFPRGNTVPTGGWNEAESDMYHHFAFDSLDPVNWELP